MKKRIQNLDDYINEIKIEDNKVIITDDDLKKFKKRGWIVDKHTDEFLNFTGAKTKYITAGFSSWMDNVTCFIEYDEDGYIKLGIKSKEELNIFFNFIDALLELDKIKTKK